MALDLSSPAQLGDDRLRNVVQFDTLEFFMS